MQTEQITLEDFIDYCKRVSFMKYVRMSLFSDYVYNTNDLV